MPDLSKLFPVPTLREIVDKYHDRETERLRRQFRVPDPIEIIQQDLDREIERRGRQWHDAMLDSIANSWSGSGDDFERDDRGDEPRRGDAGTAKSEDKPASYAGLNAEQAAELARMWRLDDGYSYQDMSDRLRELGAHYEPETIRKLIGPSLGLGKRKQGRKRGR